MISFGGGLGGSASHPEFCRFLFDALHFRDAFVVAGWLADESPGQVKTCPGVQDYEFAILIGGAGQVHRSGRWLAGGQVGEADVAVLLPSKTAGHPATTSATLTC